MNILFCSVPFRPSVGGLETVSAILAERFHASGHGVVLLTQTASNERDDEPFPIVRRPKPSALLKWIQWADVVFHNNVSLRLAWPQLVLKRPWVIAHHMWTPRTTFAGRVKHWASRFAANIAVSRAMADTLSSPATVIGNPYASDVFTTCSEIPRSKDLVFLGRLLAGKGAHVLLDAVAILKSEGTRAGLTVVGTGPEETSLRRQAVSLGIAEQVSFVGHRSGQELSRELCAHRLLVVPSVWEEPFGVVALEGLACGCVPVVARSGGLPDAVGRCGLVVPKDDAEALAEAIGRLLGDAELRGALVAGAPEQLAEHTRERVARRYLDVIENVCR
jgi:glycosyltransferase involved in cell wall biosynthesis